MRQKYSFLNTISNHTFCSMQFICESHAVPSLSVHCIITLLTLLISLSFTSWSKTRDAEYVSEKKKIHKQNFFFCCNYPTLCKLYNSREVDYNWNTKFHSFVLLRTTENCCHVCSHVQHAYLSSFSRLN